MLRLHFGRGDSMNRTASLAPISRAAIMIAAIAFLVRLAFVSAHERPLFSDEIDYDRLGATLAATGTYSDEGRPTAYRPIGYPGLIAGVYVVAGRSPRAVHAAQAALGGVSAFLLWLIAGRGRAGLWASGIWALYPLRSSTRTSCCRRRSSRRSSSPGRCSRRAGRSGAGA